MCSVILVFKIKALCKTWTWGRGCGKGNVENSHRSGNFCLLMSSMKDSTKSTGTKAACLFPVGFAEILKYKDTCQVWLTLSMHWSLHTHLARDSRQCKHPNSYKTNRYGQADCCLAFGRGEGFSTGRLHTCGYRTITDFFCELHVFTSHPRFFQSIWFWGSP